MAAQVVVIHRRGHAAGHAAAAALDAGFKRHDMSTIMSSSEYPDPRADIAVVWGANQQALWSGYDTYGVPLMVAERGYVGDRDRWVSLGWDGLNGEADHGESLATPDRWVRHHRDQWRPWRGVMSELALIIGQVETDASVRGVSMASWYRQRADEARTLGMTPIFRPHPQRPDTPPPDGVMAVSGVLSDALDRAGVVVTHSSTVAVESLIAGIPTVATGLASMAHGVAPAAIAEAGVEPSGRERWAHELAYSQWLHEEIAVGAAWAHLRGAMPCRR